MSPDWTLLDEKPPHEFDQTLAKMKKDFGDQSNLNMEDVLVRARQLGLEQNQQHLRKSIKSLRTLPLGPEHGEKIWIPILQSIPNNQLHTALEIDPSFNQRTKRPLTLLHQAGGRGIDCAYSVGWALMTHCHAGVSRADRLSLFTIQIGMPKYQVACIVTNLKIMQQDDPDMQALQDYFAQRMRAHVKTIETTNTRAYSRTDWGDLMLILPELLIDMPFCTFTMDREATFCGVCHTPYIKARKPDLLRKSTISFLERIRIWYPQRPTLTDALYSYFGGVADAGAQVCDSNCTCTPLRVPILLHEPPPIMVLNPTWFGAHAYGKGLYPGSFEQPICLRMMVFNEVRVTYWVLHAFIRYQGQCHFIYIYREGEAWRCWDSQRQRKDSLAIVSDPEAIGYDACTCILRQIRAEDGVRMLNSSGSGQTD